MGKPGNGDTTAKSKKKIGRLLHELSDSEEDTPSGSQNGVDSQQLWKQDFHNYLDVQEVLLEGMSVITWWGVRTFSCILFYILKYDYR
jgi:hypothetical protein